MMKDLLRDLGLNTSRVAFAKKIRGEMCDGSGLAFIPRVFDPGEGVTEIASWLLDAVDAWVTPNPIKAGISGRPNAEDVEASSWLLLDADPVKTPEDPEGLSEDARGQAHALVEEVCEALGYSGILIDSGRGTQLWILTDGTWPPALRRRLLRYIAAELGPRFPLVKVDATHDPARLCRLPGSVNSRTGRTAMILSPCEGQPLSVAAAEDWLGGFIDVAIPSVDAGGSFDSSPPNVSDRGWICGDAGTVWHGEGTGDRSLRDYQFLRALLHAGCPERVACRLLYSLPGGKASGDSRNAAYWGSTLESAYRTLEEEGARRDRLAGLAEACSEDAGAAFETDVLTDLAWLQRTDAPGWQRMRGALKGAAKASGFRLGDLERAITAAAAASLGPPDEVARLVIAENSEDCWLLRTTDGRWVRSKSKSVEKALQAAGASWDAARADPWARAGLPFEPQWLPGRRFNASRAQWRCLPTAGSHPMWTQLLRVVGRGLDDSVLRDEWCKASGISSGGAYLFAWLACLSQHPGARTAWLFTFSPEQNLGKSMFHEAIRRHLLAGGVTKADKALVNARGFNAELEGAVLVTVEETNLGRGGSLVRERLKDLITGPVIGLEGKGRDMREVRNYVHGYQTANSASFCPMPTGDTRITAWEALPPLESERIGKDAMHAVLMTEAPAFLHAILNWDVPMGGDGRLRIPAVKTEVKSWQQEAGRGLMSLWVEARPDWIGLSLDDVVTEAQRWLLLQGEDIRYWRRQVVLRSLPADRRTQEAIELAKRLRKLGRFSGSPTELAAKLKWESVTDLGRLLSKLEAAGTGGFTRGKRNGVRFVTTGALDGQGSENV